MSLPGIYKSTGKSIHTQGCHVWKLINGKATSFRAVVDTAQMQEAMGTRTLKTWLRQASRRRRAASIKFRRRCPLSIDSPVAAENVADGRVREANDGFEPATFGLGSCPGRQRPQFPGDAVRSAQLREVRIAVFGTHPGHAPARRRASESVGRSRATADRQPRPDRA